MATVANLLWWLIPVLSGPDTGRVDGGIVCLGGRSYCFFCLSAQNASFAIIRTSTTIRPDHTSPTLDFVFVPFCWQGCSTRISPVQWRSARVLVAGEKDPEAGVVRELVRALGHAQIFRHTSIFCQSLLLGTVRVLYLPSASALWKVCIRRS